MKKSSKWSYTLFSILALCIITDFLVPGKVVNEVVIEVNKAYQQYYNAGGNSHYSYQIITYKDSFSVTEAFAETVNKHDKIDYSVSRLFKEVNWYRLASSDKRTTYSLRIVSGLVVPLLAMLSMLIAFRYKNNIGILVFVFQTLLIADLIYLLI